MIGLTLRFNFWGGTPRLFLKMSTSNPNYSTESLDTSENIEPFVPNTLNNCIVDMPQRAPSTRAPSTYSHDAHNEPHFGSAEIIRDVIVGYFHRFELLTNF